MQRPEVVILNPAAGNGRGRRRVEPALERLRAAGHDVEVRETRGPGHARALARELVEQGERGAIAAGGDGTVYEVLDGLLSRGAETFEGERPWLGILPVGTGNSLVQDLAPDGLDSAVDALVGGRRRVLDLLRLEADEPEGSTITVHVAGNVCLGFPADVAALSNRRLKTLGAFGYSAAVLLQLGRLGTLDLSIKLDDGALESKRVAFLCVHNSPSFGGTMHVAPDARVDDGLLDVVEVDPVGRLELLRVFPKVFSGRHRDHPKVHFRRARRVELDTGGVLEVLTDGEVRPLLPRAVELLPASLDLRL